MAEYSCVILAGGKGERLYPITRTRPKPLCTVGGESCLARCIKSALSAGITDITVTCCYMADEIKKEVSRFENVKVFTEQTPLGSAGGAAECADGKSTVLVLSGDGVNTFDLRQLIDFHEKHSFICTVAVTETPYPTEFGVVRETNGEVTAFDEKPFWKNVRSDLVNTGIYLLSPEAFSYIPKGKKSDFSSDLFPLLFEKGEKIGACRLGGYWCDIGTPSAYHDCAIRFSDGMNAVSGSASIAGSAFVTSSVVMENVKIGEGSVVDSSVLCENVTVGRDVLIPDGCVIGADTVINDDAVLGRGVVLDAGTVVKEGESVMKDIRFGGHSFELFENENDVVGIYGRTFLPSDAFSLGTALAECAEDEKKIGVCFSDDDRSELLGSAVCDGVRYGGGEAYVIGSGFRSLSSFCAVEYSLEYSVFVSVDDKCGVEISVFGANGLKIGSLDAHRIKNAFTRGASDPREIKKAVVPCDLDAPLYLYSMRLLSQSQSLDGMKFFVESSTRPSQILYAVTKKLGADVSETEKPRISVRENGENVEAVTESGKTINRWQLLCFLLGEVASYRRNIFVPSDTPVAVTRYVAEKGAACIRSDEKAKDVCFRDGCFLALTVIGILKQKGMTFDDILSEIPEFFVKTIDCDYSENKKAEKTRLLCEECGGNDPVFVLEHGVVRFFPSVRRGFRVITEATGSEFSDELCDFARKKLTE